MSGVIITLSLRVGFQPFESMVVIRTLICRYFFDTIIFIKRFFLFRKLLLSYIVELTQLANTFLQLDSVIPIIVSISANVSAL